MTTCGPSQPSLFPGCEPKPLEESTSSAEGSPAKTSALQGKGRDSAGPDRGFGLSAPGLWASFDPVGHCLRMSVLSSSEGLTGCARTWRATATPSGRFWWVLASGSERRTDGTESGSSDDWQTPNTLTGGQTSRGGDRKGELLLGGQVRAEWRAPTREEAGPRVETLATKDGELRLGERLYRSGGVHQSVTLGLQVEIERRIRRSAWPTATSKDSAASGAAGYSTASGRHPGTTLTDAANGLWARPQARDWKDSGPTQGERKSPNLGTQAHSAGLLDQGNHSTSGKSRDWPNLVSTSPTGGRHGFDGGAGSRRKLTIRGVLNSHWVASLMNYPPDWCDLPVKQIERLSKPTATPSSRRSSPSSGKRSSRRTRP